MLNNKVLKNTPKTRKMIETREQVYLVGCWAKYGVMPYHFAGEFVWTPGYKEYLPLVYEYYDGNGTCDEWHIVPLYDVTTGSCYAWSFNEEHAKRVAQQLECGSRAFYDKYRRHIDTTSEDKE